MNNAKWFHFDELYRIAMAFLGDARQTESILTTVFAEANTRGELYQRLGAALLTARRRPRWTWWRDAMLEAVRAMPAQRGLLVLWVEVADFTLEDAGEMLGLNLDEAQRELAAGRAGLAERQGGGWNEARSAASR